MKNRISGSFKLWIYLSLSSLLFMSFSTPMKRLAFENIIITLRVDTGQIDKKNASASCNFGQAEGISNEEFTIEVNVGDVITWEGISSSSPDTDVVDITKIKYVKGKNIFGKDLDTADGGKHKKVSAQVLASTAVEGDYKYDISFTVTNNGAKRNGTFHIDPVIRVH